MTKQQQEAYNKFLKVLELQEQGIQRQEIYKMVGYASIDSLTKALKKQGYKYSEQEQKYIQVCNTEYNTNSNMNSSTQINTKCITTGEVIEVHRNNIMVEPEQLEFIKVLEEERETLKSMLEWYKQYSNRDKNNTGIIIELPASENIMISTRSNKVVWEQFKVFAKNNSANFKMGDLVAQALLDYLKKHS